MNYLADKGEQFSLQNRQLSSLQDLQQKEIIQAQNQKIQVKKLEQQIGNLQEYLNNEKEQQSLNDQRVLQSLQQIDHTMQNSQQFISILQEQQYMQNNLESQIAEQNSKHQQQILQNQLEFERKFNHQNLQHLYTMKKMKKEFEERIQNEIEEKMKKELLYQEVKKQMNQNMLERETKNGEIQGLQQKMKNQIEHYENEIKYLSNTNLQLRDNNKQLKERYAEQIQINQEMNYHFSMFAIREKESLICLPKQNNNNNEVLIPFPLYRADGQYQSQKSQGQNLKIETLKFKKEIDELCNKFFSMRTQKESQDNMIKKISEKQLDTEKMLNCSKKIQKQLEEEIQYLQNKLMNERQQIAGIEQRENKTRFVIYQLHETMDQFIHWIKCNSNQDDQKKIAAISEIEFRQINIQMAAYFQQLNDLISSKKTVIDLYNAAQKVSELEQTITKLKEQIIEQTVNLERKNIQIEGLEQQVSQLKIDLNNNSIGKTELCTQISDLKNEIHDQAKKFDTVTLTLEDVKEELVGKVKDLQQLNEKLNQAMIKNQTLSSDNTVLIGQFRQLQFSNEILQKDQNQTKQQVDEQIEIKKQMILEIEFKNQILQQICSNHQFIDKIIGPMEQIVKNYQTLLNRADDLQYDQVYIAYEISLDNVRALKLLKEQKWTCLDKCLKFFPQGYVEAKNRMPTADITLVKGELIEIEEAQNSSLRQKKLLKKQYKSQAIPMLKTKEEAGKLSLNNLLCKLMLEKFNEIDGVKGTQQYFIQRQFVFQVKDKQEYFYCEIIEEGPFEKINGGIFQLGNSEIHQYLNSFSLFTYHLMNKQMIISNLQVVGKYLYDMIVSTQYKIFTPIDQGQKEIDAILAILENAPQNYFQKFWNESIQKQAKIKSI